MFSNLTPKCRCCGNRFAPSPNDKEPIMVGFELEDGTVINLCRYCLKRLESAQEQGNADEFLKRMNL